MSDDGSGLRLDTIRRRSLVSGAAVAAVVGASAFACDSSPSEGSQVNANAKNANDLQDQEEKLTIEAFDAANKIPSQQYPGARMVDTLEMRNLRKKLLMMNDASKQGWFYGLAASGVVLFKLEVLGKVSSTQSSMTTDNLVYKDQGTGGGGNVVVQGPGDDLSYGRNEGGDLGVFFYTPEGGYVSYCGYWLYTDFEMAVGPDGRLQMGSGKPTKSQT